MSAAPNYGATVLVSAFCYWCCLWFMKRQPRLWAGFNLIPMTVALFGGLRPPGGRPIPLLRAFLGRTSDIYWIFR
jgi:hypothetical protein